MKTIELSFALVFLFLVSCTESQSDTESQEENTAVNSETEKEGGVTEEDETTIAQGIGDYTDQYSETVLAELQKSSQKTTLIDKTVDEVNGFAQLTYDLDPDNAGQNTQVVQLGLWKDSQGNSFLGTFQFQQINLPDVNSKLSSADNLKFFDTQWNDITAEKINVEELTNLDLEARTDLTQKYFEPTPGSGMVMTAFVANIPQSGTDITLEGQIFIGDNPKETIGTLKYNIDEGTFSLEK